MKTCRRCLQHLPFEAFYRDRAKRDGRASYCEACSTAKAAEWMANNPDKARVIRHRQYQNLSPGRRAQRRAAASEYIRTRYRDDAEWRERLRVQNAARYAANRESRKAATKAWTAAHPDRMIEATHRRRARLRDAVIGPVSRLAVMERDNWTCWICGERTEPDGLRPRRPSLDHVVALVDGGSHTEDNLRCAHVGCNSSRFNRGRRRQRRAHAHRT